MAIQNDMGSCMSTCVTFMKTECREASEYNESSNLCWRFIYPAHSCISYI